jgi:hypothetical protein
MRGIWTDFLECSDFGDGHLSMPMGSNRFEKEGLLFDEKSVRWGFDTSI